MAKISGTIIDKQTKKPVPDLQIQLWDVEGRLEKQAANFKTNQEGNFVSYFSSNTLSTKFGRPPYPKLYLKILKNDQLLHSTKDTLLWDPAKDLLDVRIEIEMPQVHEDLFTVRGTIRLEDGTPLSGAKVIAFDKDLRLEEKIGESPTEKDGRYVIRYSAKQFRRREKSRANLIVRVFINNRDPVIMSDIIFSAASEVTVDLTVPADKRRGPSEYERLLSTIKPLLENAPIAELEEDDISFLVGETGFALDILEAFVIAHQLAKSTEMLPEFFYGVVRQGGPNTALPRMSDLEELLMGKQTGAPISRKADRILDALVATESDSLMQTLDRSIQMNLVPTGLDLSDLRTRWETYRQKHLKEEVVGRTRVVNRLIDLAKMPQAKRAAFVSRYLDKRATPTFWKELRKSHLFEETEANRLEATFRLSAFLDDEPGLVERVVAAYSVKHPDALRRLAGLDSTDWEKVLAGSESPEGQPEEAEQSQRKAASIAARFQTTYPTAALLGRMEKDERFPHRQKILPFLAQHPDIELLRLNIDHFFKEHRISDDPTHLKGVQRVFKLAPNYHATKALFARGIHSAQQIYFLGSDRLRATLAEEGVSASESDKIYIRAEKTYAATLHLTGELNSLLRGSSIPAFSVPDEVRAQIEKEFPNLKTLFSTTALCECESCRSVQSPAAYLVDVMRFLDERQALSVVLARRSDIGEIELSCANTNITLPYIDLVNEILEDMVATNAFELPGGLSTHLRSGAIPFPLRDAFLEKGLPISLDAEVTEGGKPDVWVIRDEEHTYGVAALNNLLTVTISRQTHGTAEELAAHPEYVNAPAYDKLKNANYPLSLPFDLDWEELGAYLRNVRLQRHDLMALVGNSTRVKPADIAAEFLTLNPMERDIVTGKQPAPWGGLTNIDRVSVFLKETRLTYGQLQELLACRFTNAIAPQSRVVYEGDSCDTENMSVSNLAGNNDRLGRIQRFLRLWKKLNLTMNELDRLIQCSKLGGGNLDEPFLLKLKPSRMLQDRLGLTVEELLCFYENLPTTGESPLYQRVFLNKALIDPLDEAFALPAVSDPQSTQTISEHADTFNAALKLRFDELALLVRPSDRLILANISHVYRHVLLAKKLSLSVAELVAAIDLMSEPGQYYDPFDTPEGTLEMVEAVHRIRSLGLTIHSLNYLLKNIPHASLADIPTDAKIAAFLSGLRVEFESVEAGAKPPPEAGIATTADEEEEASAKEQARLDAKIAAVRKMVASEFGLADELAGLMLERFKLQGATETLAMLFVKSELLVKFDKAYAYPIDESTLSGVFVSLADAYKLLHKVTRLLAATPVEGQAIVWLYPEPGESNAEKVDLLDFCKLPVTNNHPVVPFRTFVNWLDWYGFTRLYPFSPYSNLDTLARPAATEAEFVTALSAATEWPETAISQLIDLSGLQFPVDFKCHAALHRLHRWFQVIHAMDMTPDDIGHVIRRNPGPENVARVKKLVRARYETRQWLEASKVIQNDLRPRKRDALVAYLLHHPPAGASWTDSSDLYAHLLLDVDMSACMDTTRILQASLSLQQFVQRCQMNLEKEVIADANSDRGWLQWSWMKNYRIWEANRRIFLYPENWIEPELRTDKSQFFQELENELMQNEFTHQNAENAYANYLAKLDDIARLDVCGLYFEEATETLHVFARTYDDPYVYYYRRWVEDRYWTPWEKIDADIKSNQLVPLVINRRIYLYWPEFMEEVDVPAKQKYPQEPAPGQTEIDTPPSKKRWKIRLGVSEYRNKKWTPKKLSTSYLVVPMDDPIQVPGASGETIWDYSPKEIDFSFLPIDRLDLTRFVPGLLNLLPPDLRPAAAQLFAQCLTNLEAGRRCEIQCVRAGKASEEISVRGKFDLFGCKGVPEANRDSSLLPRYMTFERSFLESAEHAEGGTSSDDSLVAVGVVAPRHKILDLTPGRFRVRQTFQLSCFDELFLLIQELRMCPEAKKLGVEIKQKPPPFTVGTFLPFFYEDYQRTFFVQPEFLVRDPQEDTLPGILSVLAEPEDWDEYFYTDLLQLAKKLNEEGSLLGVVRWYFEGGFNNTPFRYLFRIFYHPHVCFFLKRLYINGVDELLSRDVQCLNQARYSEDLRLLDFQATYGPSGLVNDGSHVDLDLPELERHGYPIEDVDFTRDGSYSSYNWELFFHAPLLIATRLSDNQRFEEALRWFHYIFNPTDTSSYEPPQRYWITRPFFERSADEYVKQRIDQIMLGISSKENAELSKCVEDWRNNPFDPHLIAKFRTVAYQKTVVMKYLDTLIAWGDYLFRQDTRESLNQAAQLYVLAAEILGRKPMAVPAKNTPPVKSFNQLQSELDDFGNALVEIENRLPFWRSGALWENRAPSLPRLGSLYFCIPDNENLLCYWDTVADRLYKIRNCMNIEGVRRRLDLFQPPIEPGLLVRAAAAGVSIEAVLGELSAPLPHYRFHILLQKAMDFCDEVRRLGGALLAALEKRDAEALSLLRATHEIDLLKAVESVKTRQIEETQQKVAALKGEQLVINQRKAYYQGLKDEGYLAKENVALGLNVSSVAMRGIGILLEALSGGLHAIPQVKAGAAGVGGSAIATVEAGGQQAASATAKAASALLQGASLLDKTMSLLFTLAKYDRMKKEWEHQIALADIEQLQVANQIAAAQIRAYIAEQELENHRKQVEQSQSLYDNLRTKFSNQDLYDWMSSQISTIYFQAYQLAFDMAKRAERAYRFELGLTESNFIQFGHWDSLRKGLLAGERLVLDLKRLEAAYLEKNRRELEITRHVSLVLHDPMNLIELKETGQCEVELPESYFDADYPGHYFRRIKNVSITIPCVVGPYTSINCTLTLLKNRIRKDATAIQDDGKSYRELFDAGQLDPRFIYNYGSIDRIATSHGQGDAGLFELNFRDERYLPFEGAGAISTWRIDLPKENNAFDFDTISDVILKLNYTARDGGNILRSAASAWLNTLRSRVTRPESPDEPGPDEPGLAPRLQRLFIVRHEFSNQWHRFLSMSGSPQLELSFDSERFPYLFRGSNISITGLNLILCLLPEENGVDPNELGFSLTSSSNNTVFAPGGDFNDFKWTPWPEADSRLWRLHLDGLEEGMGIWRLTTETTASNLRSAIQELMVIVEYIVKL